MKRKFAVLAVLGALIALVVPASSMATMSPVGAKFEISGTPQTAFATSLGKCELAKITGQVPASGNVFAIPTPTVGGCNSGVSLTLSGEWKFAASNYTVLIYGGQLTMRFASLPGCKLSGTVEHIVGIWSNGLENPSLKSAFHADSSQLFPWSNDGGTCALAGTLEEVSFQNVTGNAFGPPNVRTPYTTPVTNLSYPNTPIIVSK